MKTTFTFLAGLFLAISLNAADIAITSADNLATAYTNAAAGDVIILGDGTYTVDATINLTKGITIKALNPLQATVIGTGFIFNTSAITDVRIEGLIFDGTKAIDQVKQLYFTDINGAATLNNVTIENCKILNYGNCLLRANRAEAVCNDFKVNNSVLRSIGASNAYPFFQMTKTKVNRLEFTNNTVADLANEYIQFYGTVAGNDNAVLLFKNNTFYNTVTNTGRRPFGGKSGKVYVQNNIFVKSPVHTVGEIGFDVAVTTVELTNNVINDFAGGALMSAAGWLVNTGNQDIDPLFKDVATYDFTLPANSALITANIGDPRWFGTPSGVKNTTIKALNVYPNPTADIIYFGKTISKVEIIDLVGKVVKSQQNVSESNLKSLSVGTYLVRAFDAEGTLSVQKVARK
jgi:hypothetical protein